MVMLITGATGFLGSHLAERLVQEGQKVRALVRATSDAAALQSLGVEIVHGDMRDPRSLRDAVRGCTRVFHLAAASSRRRPTKDDHYTINVAGTKQLAEAALEEGIERFVYASSGGVYGTIKVTPVDEESPVAPNSHYRRSKLLGEQAVRSLYCEHRLPVVVARISSAYGPRSGNWLGLFRAVAAGRIRIVGSGSNRVHMGFVSDIVEGVKLCGEVPGIEGRSYIVAGSTPTPFKDYVHVIADELGVQCTLAPLPALPFRLAAALREVAFRVGGIELPRADILDLHLGDREFDISRARIDLGYEPKVALCEGLRETLQWYRSRGLL